MGGTVKLGIIGFGRIVELVHLPLLKKVPEIQVCGVCDVTPQRLALAAKRGFHAYDRLEDLLASDIDAVLIATPPSSHYPLAAQALRQGKHVVVEKPVTATAEQAAHLCELAKAGGKAATVFHNRRFDNDFLHVKRLLAEEALGRILFVDRRHHMFGSGASFGVKSFHPDWRNEAEYGGGALLDWGVHLVDQLLQLRLGQCEQVSARMHALRWRQGDVDDYVRASFKLDNGVVMSMEINFGSNAAAPLWIVGGEKATLQINSPKEAVWMEKGKPARSIALDPVSPEGPERIYSSFCGCVLRGEEPAVSLEQAAETMAVIDRIRQAATMEGGR